MPLNQELSLLFARIAQMMELKGENTFKVLAFQRVSRLLENLTVDLRQCVAEGTLGKIEGIGKSSQQIIEEYLNSGKSTVHDELAETIPPGLGDLLRIEGLGGKTIHQLWKERDITSITDLETALDTGALVGLKGFGEKKIANLKQGVELFKQRATGGDGGVRRLGIGEVIEPAEHLLEQVRALPGVARAELAGSYRRRRETIADIDIVAAVDGPALGESITQAFTTLDTVIQTVGQGATKASVKISNGMQADLRVVPTEHLGAALLYFTGSKEHNVKIRGLAQKKNLTLNEWGLYRLDEYDRVEKQTAQAPPIAPVASRTESDIYAALDLQFVEPELREDLGEVEAAADGTLPTLVTSADLRSDLHTHTTASDGQGTIEQMIEAALAIGYSAIAITDHSKAQAIANGLTAQRLLAHIADIRKAAARYKDILVLAGAEVDILADGSMDYEDAILAELDIVIASPHMALRQPPDKATDRLKRAIEHRYVNLIAHPTGRLINRREGIAPDFNVLFPLAARTGTAMEINASYPRLDLNDRNARAALAAGVTLSINTDAHSPEGVGQSALGIDVARRAGATKKQVLNCFTPAQLKKFLSRKR